MPNRQRVDELIEQVRSGRFIQAFEEFYHQDVSMKENLNPATEGKSANLEREKAWLDSIREFHENKPTFVAVEGDRVALGWLLEYTTKDGQRVRTDQVSIQEWRGDRIARERFVYDPTTVVVKEAVSV